MGGILQAGASLVGSIIGSNASKSAASTQAAAANQATAEQQRQYNQTRSDQMPFYNTGVGANQQLSYLLGINQNPYSQTDSTTGQSTTVNPYQNVDQNLGSFGSLSQPFNMQNYQEDPGYQFRLQQGLQALDRANSAKGAVNSGGALKGVTDYAQGLASQEYQNAFNRYNTNQTNLYNRLAGVSGTGQTSANTLASTGQATANNISGNTLAAGNTTAAGQIGNANAWSTGLTKAANAFTNPFGGFGGNDTPINTQVGTTSPWGSVWQS